MRDRGRCVKSFGERPGKPLLLRVALDIAQRHIQADAVSGHMVQRVPPGDVVSAAPNEDGHFDFVMKIPGYRWNSDRVPFADDRCCRFQEEYRGLGYRGVHLFCVVGIIPADAKDLSDFDRFSRACQVCCRHRSGS